MPATSKSPTLARCGWGRAEWAARQKGRKAVLYVIRLYGNGEVFYKVGITFCLASRFTKLNLPYRWRTIARYSSYSAGKVWDLEQRLHSSDLSRYVPLLDFAGKTECYASAEQVLALLPPKTFILKHITADV
ncbi:hypothetical protein [Hymenobacter mucosus]|uniref:Meiotically up-regulated gene 113 n=1 Tax=Hymenobacter mucosus TaxID=1411120 RepID=A0A239AC58_9BACT|nr:hypothetical protein [Hymenobacter mucosus]SNR92638.1 hypothetical protein SAMN06269173_111112 [Hymenobacter mucosus]